MRYAVRHPGAAGGGVTCMILLDPPAGVTRAQIAAMHASAGCVHMAAGGGCEVITRPRPGSPHAAEADTAPTVLWRDFKAAAERGGTCQVSITLPARIYEAAAAAAARSGLALCDYCAEAVGSAAATVPLPVPVPVPLRKPRL